VTGEGIDVFELAERGGRVEGSADPARMTRLEGLATPLAGDDGLHFLLQGMFDPQGRPAATLRLHGAVGLHCDRCERPLHWPIDEQRQYYFVRTERELAAIPVDDQTEEALLANPYLDLDSLIEDEAILALPLSPRHAVCPPAETTVNVAAPAAPRAAVAEADGEPPTHRPFAGLARLRGRRLS
jgi:uncharacterized protein